MTSGSFLLLICLSLRYAHLVIFDSEIIIPTDRDSYFPFYIRPVSELSILASLLHGQAPIMNPLHLF